MVYDSLRATDYLGAQMWMQTACDTGPLDGQHHGMVDGALHPDIKVCVDLCCLTDCGADRISVDGHGIYYYVLLAQALSTSDINVLIAPLTWRWR